MTRSVNLTYKEYNDENSLINALKNNEVNAIILPRLDYLEDILKSDNMYIAYNITEYKINYIIKLGDNDRLNKILTKYFNKWKNNDAEKSFNNYLSNAYFEYKNISEKTQTEFRSKRYNYGFVENAPFDTLLDNRLAGINYQLLSSFSDLTSAEISYREYSNINDLLNAFNSNEIDLFYGINASEEYALDVYKTVPVF